MAKKPANFNAAQGLFSNNRLNTQEVQNTSQVQDVLETHEVCQEQYAQDTYEVQRVYDVEGEMLGQGLRGTQGKKGHKLPRINMAFSLENHEFIKRRSRQIGISATDFVNQLIDRERKIRPL